MAKRRKIVPLLCVHFMVLFYLVSCGDLSNSIRVNVPRDQVNVTPPDNKIPLKAALYLTPTFRTTQTPYVIRGRKFGDVYVGEALTGGAEKMVRNLFQEITVLDQIGTAQGSTVPNYDVIVTPQVEQFEYRFVAAVVGGHFATQNAINWRIVSPDGKEVYQNTIRTDEKKVETRDQERHPEIPIMETLKEQFQKAQEDIYSNGWWKKQWWKEKN